jgi:hypothetical protein
MGSKPGRGDRPERSERRELAAEGTGQPEV